MHERSVFLAALDIADPARREEFLVSACAGDPEIRQSVEELLADTQAAATFLDTPAAALDGTASADEALAPSELSFLAPGEEPLSLGRLGNYEVLRPIGRGGMGIVLVARDTRLERLVALKVLAPHLAASAAARERFLREAKAAATVRDEHVVTILAIEEEHDLPFLVMEMIDGMSLQQWLHRQGPLPLAEIVRIGSQVAQGLAAAHAHGLVHRDVKPANILLERNSQRVKLTDFGLARVVDQNGLTQSGLIVGTPSFMSPEQARGEEVDFRADLFSLGCVLYAMAAGQSPFHAATTIGIIRRVCDEAPRPLEDCWPEIPDWLAALIGQLLAKDPAHRPPSAAKVAELLSQGFACGLAKSSDRKLADAPAKHSALRTAHSALRWRSWSLAAALLVCATAGLAVSELTGLTHFMPAVIRVVTGEGVLTVTVDDPNVKVTVDGRDVVITESGVQEVRVRPGKHTVEATKDGQPVPVPEPIVTISRGGRQTVHITRESLPGRATPQLPATALVPAATEPPAVAWQPPPPGAVDALDPANIPAGDRFDWQPRELVQVLGTHRGMMWADPTIVVTSPDDQWIASAGYGGHIYLWDAKTLALRRMLSGHGANINIWGLAFFPDNKRLVSGGDDKLIRVWDSETGHEIGQLAGHTESVWGVAVTPDSQRVLSGSKDRTVRLWDLATSAQVHVFEGHTGGVGPVEISPDGRRVLSGGEDHTMCLWDLESRQLVYQFQGHTATCRRVAFLADGRRAVSCSHDKSVRLWDLDARSEIRRYLGHTSEVYGLAVTGDQRRAVSTGRDGTIRVWDLETSDELMRLASPQPLFGFSSLAAVAGQHVVSGGHEGAIRLWDLDKRAEVDPGRVKPLLSNASRLSISDDGRRVLASLANVAAVVYDVHGGTVLRSFPQPRGFICAALSPDGTEIVCGDQQSLSAWSVETGKQVREFPGSSKICHLVFSSDGRTILTGDYSVPGGGGFARLWNAQTGEELVPLGPHVTTAVQAVSQSTEHGRALGACGTVVRLWSLESGNLLNEWRHTHAVWSVAISPDGRYAASSDDGGYVQVRDLSTPEPKLLPLAKIHTHWVRSVVFSPDSRQLLSAGYDGRLVLRELPSGKIVRQWQFPGFIHAATFTPDGRHLATLNGNATVYILRLATPDQPK